MLSPNYDVKSLIDLPKRLEIEETGTTFCENALMKAKALALAINQPAIGDDSGICITVLDDFPGIYSRRWALPLTGAGEVNNHLLELLRAKGLTTKADRAAKMVSCLAYYDPHTNQVRTFTGELQGSIATKPKGDLVFGYDQVFEVEDTNQTLSELNIHKNDYSPRAKALHQLLTSLESEFQ